MALAGISASNRFKNLLGFGIALAVIVPFLAVSPAGAQQSATCRSLQAQLASIETGRGSRDSRTYQRYDRAVRQQLVQIKKTERAARKNGCGLLRTNICKRINTSLQKMTANLTKLQAVRDKASGQPTGDIGRADILRAMKINGCYSDNTRTASLDRQPNRRRTLLEQIFGTKTYSDEGSAAINNPSLGRNYGTYQTLCVRTCDGYYFPISFSTTQEHFADDANQCQQMCPGAETALYFHPMPSGDPEASISYRTGEPYASLPKAFAYRKGLDNACSCRFASRPQGFEEIAGVTASEKAGTTTQEPAIPTPVFRKDLAQDPDSFQNLEGGLTLKQLAAISENKGEATAEKREIRIVGPAFFPVQ